MTFDFHRPAVDYHPGLYVSRMSAIFWQEILNAQRRLCLWCLAGSYRDL